MADRTQLGQAAFDRQQVYYMDPMLAWEQRLASAYDEAVAHLKAAIPPGTTVDLAKYELAADMAGSSLTTHSDAWLQGFRENKDPSVASGLLFDPSRAKEYYLGHFAQASANIGVFITGYAREQITLGALSQADFDTACDMRLRALSDIIYLGRTGQLKAVVDADGWGKENAPGDTKLVVATDGLYTGEDAQGLGTLGAPAIVAIVIVCALAGAGIGVAVMWAAENAKQRRIALDICQDAVRRGHPDASKICGEMRGLVADLANPANIPNPVDMLIPKEMQKTIAYAAAGITGVALVLAFAPQIMRSLSRTGEVYAEEKSRRLRKLQEEF